jgi:hypothetical protein
MAKNLLVFYHTHRLGAHYRTGFDGLPLVAFENGCLCDLTPPYMLSPNWQQGFSVVTMDRESDLFHVDQLPIIRGKVAWGVQIVKAWTN